ncbi:membrane metalloprotease [Winogradskyella rapida]|uniref:Membrane metalloprotease n=1 Tax=Winogradskyella rapida TaxID=549701 RepID=A0ABW3KRW9_9FLAO
MVYKILAISVLLLLITGCATENTLIDGQADDVNVSLNRQNVGTSAHDFLSDDTYTSLLIEMVYVEGFEPQQSSISNLITFINNRTYKPDGVTIEKRSIASPGLETYSIQDIADIEMAERTRYNTEDQMTLWVYFSDGQASSNSQTNVVLGTAYWNSSFVIFEDSIQSVSNGPFDPDRELLETTVITHEFGHLLGLTNLGTPMETEHEDEAHPKHCNNENCLMYWSSESSAGLENMINMSAAPELDNACLNDLLAQGGK